MSVRLVRHHQLALLIIAIVAIGGGSIYCYGWAQANKCINNDINEHLYKQNIVDLIKKRSGAVVSIDTVIIGKSAPHFDGDIIVDFSVPTRGFSGIGIGNGCGMREIF